jgi:hypothetical protein
MAKRQHGLKGNALADKLTDIAMKQLLQSWTFKLPRINRIADFRRLYNGMLLPRLRIQFAVPIPVFSGMVDTLQSDLDDDIILEFKETDPADWKAIEKVNAAIKQVSQSMRPDAQWSKKFRLARHECIMTGRGILKFTAGRQNKDYYSSLEVATFEDFFFEPKGGLHLEDHLFCGQQNIWKNAKELKDGTEEGIYDKAQVSKLVEVGRGSDWKSATLWDSHADIANRFKPLGLSIDSNNWVGESVFHLVEWVLTYEGRKWYILFDGSTGTWVRFEKLTDINSGGFIPWISFASHEDPKNFASKAIADDLYPVADSIITLFNQELTNRQKRLLGARAYDKDIFKDIQKLDEAQWRPDAWVPADTKGGTRRISEGIYSFETPELSGTIDVIDWLERMTGKHIGVTETQQGAPQPAAKRVGVTFAELAQVSKRISFKSKPIIEAANELGLRFFNSLQDYMTKPMAVRLIGEHGVEWDVLKRVELDLKKDFEILITSQQHRDRINEMEKSNKVRALEMTAQSPNINTKARDELIYRLVGGFEEHEIEALMDLEATADKEMKAETSAAIQEIVLRNKKPETNYNANLFYLKKIISFVRKYRNTLTEKQFKIFMEVIEEHRVIVEANLDILATEALKKEMEIRRGLVPAGRPEITPETARPTQFNIPIPNTPRVAGEIIGLEPTK